MPVIPLYDRQIGRSRQAMPSTGSAPGRSPIEGIGHAMRDVADSIGDLAREQARQQREAERIEAERTEAYVTQKAADARLHWVQEEGRRRQAAPPGADGYTPTLLKDFDAWTEEQLAAAPEAAREPLRARLTNLQATLAGDALTFEATAGREHRRTQARSAAQAWANAAYVDPARAGDMIAESDSSLPSMGLGTDADEMRRSSAAAIAEAHFRRVIEDNPSEAARRLAGDDPIASRLDPERRAVLASQANDGRYRSLADNLAAEAETAPQALIDRLDGKTPSRAGQGLYAALERQESAGDPKAVSRKGAVGLMQLIPSTAREVAGRLGLAQLAGLDDEAMRKQLEDPALNRRLGRVYLDEQLAKYGGNRTLALAAYNAGPARVDEWLGSIGDPRAGGMSDAEWLARVPFKETRDHVAAVLEGAGPTPAGAAGDDPRATAIMGAARRAAEKNLASGKAERAHALKIGIDNDLARVADGREPITRSRADFAAAFQTVAEADAEWADYQSKLAYGRTRAELASLSGADIARRLEATRPDPNSPTYAQDREGWLRVQEAAADVVRARNVDPAASALAQNPTLHARVQELAASDDPAERQLSVALLLAEQQRLGIPEHARSALTKAGAAELAATFADEPDNRKKVGMLVSATAATADARTVRRTLRTLEEEGLPKGMEAVIAAARRGEPGTAANLLAAATAPKLDMDLETNRALKAAVEYEWAQGPGAYYATGGQWTDDAAYQVRAQGERELLEKRTATLVLAGHEPYAAAKQAAAEIGGRRLYLIERELGAVSAPAGTDLDALEIGLEEQRRRQLAAIDADQVRKVVDPEGKGGAVAEGDIRMSIENWPHAARWMDAAGEPGRYTLTVPVRAEGGGVIYRAMRGKDGRPIEITAAQAAATRPDPAATSYQDPFFGGPGIAP